MQPKIVNKFHAFIQEEVAERNQRRVMEKQERIQNMDMNVRWADLPSDSDSDEGAHEESSSSAPEELKLFDFGAMDAAAKKATDEQSYKHKVAMKEKVQEEMDFLNSLCTTSAKKKSRKNKSKKKSEAPPEVEVPEASESGYVQVSHSDMEAARAKLMARKINKKVTSRPELSKAVAEANIRSAVVKEVKKFD